VAHAFLYGASVISLLSQSIYMLVVSQITKLSIGEWYCHTYNPRARIPNMPMGCPCMVCRCVTSVLFLIHMYSCAQMYLLLPIYAQWECSLMLQTVFKKWYCGRMSVYCGVWLTALVMCLVVHCECMHIFQCVYACMILSFPMTSNTSWGDDQHPSLLFVHTVFSGRTFLDM
jgi:hypothetical protein